MDETEEILNKAAQGLVTKSQALLWFKELSADERLRALRQLQCFALQAHAYPNDVQQAILESEIKESFTPCVLLQKKELREAIAKIVMLPENEQEKSFILLLSLFAVADRRRRRTQCKDGCNHEWHNMK